MTSLRRLGTDYVDLYQIHRWDYDTPIEETLEALHDVVKAGKARYIGASSMHAWQFARALADRRAPRLDPLRQHAEPGQPALSRGGARDAAALRRRGHRGHSLEPAGPRQTDPRLGLHQHPHRDRRGVRRGCSPRPKMPTARSSIAWRRLRRRAAFRAPRWRSPGCWRSRSSPRRSSAPPSCSTSTMRWPRFDVKLSDDEIASLEEPYVPHAVVGFD